MMPPDHNPAILTTTPGGHPDSADLSLYAMQLLAPDEAAPLAMHLAACADCRAELARNHGDLALAALAVDLESPSANARQRLLDQVAREKKIVPAPQTLAQPQALSASQPQSLAQPSLKPIAAFGRSGTALSGYSVLSMEDRKPRRPVGIAILAGLGWAAAAAISLVAGSLMKDRQALRTDLFAQAGQIQRLTADAASAHQLMDALTDPGAMRVTLTLTGTPKPKGVPIGGVTYNPAKGSLVFLASDLVPVQQYKAYELWIIPSDNSMPIPAGTFHPDRQGNASIVMPDLPRGITAKAFGVTIEPDGGSQLPTMPLVMFGT